MRVRGTEPGAQWRRGFAARWLALALLLLCTPLVTAATTDMGAPGGSLAGQLLIAAPDMDDPRFAHTVILMVQHDQGGALGIIINRPVGELSYADLLKSIGTTGKPVEGKVRIFAGGPVELSAGFVLHSTEYRRPETRQLESELMRRSWFTAAEDPALVFDDDRGRVWKDAMDRRSQAL